MLQAGYSADFAPLCIGSHYAVRTAALRSIGGLGPELARGLQHHHSDERGGWRGAFAIDAAAHGDGPASVADCLTQEFQWSSSVTRIFLSMWSAWGPATAPCSAPARLRSARYLMFTRTCCSATSCPILALVFSHAVGECQSA